MAKMMMGQIDHARNRVRALKQEKLGDAVKPPKYKNGKELLQAVRDSKAEVTPAQVKAAWIAYVDKVVSNNVEETPGSYRNGYNATYKVRETAPTSVEEALSRIVFIKENTAELVRFEQETTLYKLKQEILDLEASAVEDAIVLGDQQAALAALKDFAAFVVLP